MICDTFKNINQYKNNTGAFEDNTVYQTPFTKNITKLNEDLLYKIYQINNNLLNLEEKKECIQQVTDLINNTFPNKEMYWYALSTSKYFPKKILLNESVYEKNKKLRYALFQRDDLTKKDIKFLINLIKPSEFKVFLSDRNAYIHPHNVDILCNLQKTDQKMMEYRCFSRLCGGCFWYNKLTELLNDSATISLNSHKNEIELLATALLDNPNISDEQKEKIYQQYGIVIECSNKPPKNILKDIYPSVADTVCDENLDVDKKLKVNAIDTMARYFINNTLSDAMMGDFMNRISLHSKYKNGNLYKLTNAIENVAESSVMEKAIEIGTPEMISAVMKNKNFPSDLLRKIKPKIDFYMAYPKTEMHSLFIISMIDTANSLKIADLNECKKYIDNNDVVAIKLMLANPYTPTSVISKIKEYVDKLPTNECYNDFNVLFDLRLALNDAKPTSQQFLMHKFLEYQLEANPITSNDKDPDFITSDLFFKKHNFVNNDEMMINGFDTITKIKVKELIKQYNDNKKDTSILNKLYNYMYGYKDYRYFAESQYKILIEENGKYKLDLGLLYKKYKENPEAFSNNLFKLSDETQKIFLQEFSKELCICKHKELQYEKSELLVNIFVDMENFYKELSNQFCKTENILNESVKNEER